MGSLFYMLFFLPKRTSITNIKAATKRRRFIKTPPILNIKPMSQNKITNPPNHLKKAKLLPPFTVLKISYNHISSISREVKKYKKIRYISK